MASFSVPWAVGMGSSSFKTLSGSKASHLTQRYSERNYSEEFLRGVEETSRAIRSNSLYRNSVSALRRLRHARKSDTVRRLTGIGELQHAPSVMESYLVANPVVRRNYNKRMEPGYEDGFSKRDRWRGTAIKHTDSNYRVVMDGYLDTEENKFHSYVLDDEEKSALTLGERLDVQACWREQIRVMMETDDAVTSTYNAMRG